MMSLTCDSLCGHRDVG